MTNSVGLNIKNVLRIKFSKREKKKYFVLLLHLRECDYRALLHVEPSEDQTDSVNLFHWVVLRVFFFVLFFSENKCKNTHSFHRFDLVCQVRHF